MTDEEKKAADTAKAEEAKKADADFEESIATLTDEEKTAKRTEREAQAHSQPIDYKAIAEKEREAREKAEKALAEDRFKSTERKRKEKEARIAAGESAEDIDAEEKDKVITPAELDVRLAREREATEKRLNESRARELAKSMTDSPDAAEAVFETYMNRHFPEHFSLDQKVAESFYIVNGPIIIGQNQELGRALRGKGTIQNNSAGTHRDPAGGSGTAPGVSAETHASLVKQGFALNPSTKQYEKTLQNGGKMIRDLKKNKNVFIPKS